MEDILEINDNEHFKDSSNTIREIWESEELFDVYIKINENIIPCHKIILAASSPYFRTIFNGKFKESTQNVITINIFELETIETIIKYIYTGKIHVSGITNITKVLKAADFFGINNLLKNISDNIINNLTVASSFNLFYFSATVSLEYLKSTIRDFIFAQNINDLTKSHEFLDLPIEYISKFLEESISLKNENIAPRAFKMITFWVKYDYENRKEFLQELLKFIDVNSISLTMLNSVIKAEKFLLENPNYTKWLSKNFTLQHTMSNTALNDNIFIYSTKYKEPHFLFNLKKNDIRKLEKGPDVLFYVSLYYKNRIYLFGGRYKGRFSNVINAFEIEKNCWRYTRRYINRSGHTGTVLNDKGYLIGGQYFMRAQNSVSYYDFYTEKVIPTVSMNESRWDSGARTSENVIYVCGGYKSTPNGVKSLKSMEKLDPREGKWTNLANTDEIIGECSLTSIGNFLYARNNDNGHTYTYDIRLDTWFNDIAVHERQSKIFSLGNQLYSIRDKGLSKYCFDDNQWLDFFKYDFENPSAIVLDY